LQFFGSLFFFGRANNEPFPPAAPRGTLRSAPASLRRKILPGEVRGKAARASQPLPCSRPGARRGGRGPLTHVGDPPCTSLDKGGLGGSTGVGDAQRGGCTDIPHPLPTGEKKERSWVLSRPPATARTGDGFGDTALGTATLPQHLPPRCGPSTYTPQLLTTFFRSPRAPISQTAGPPSPPPLPPTQGHPRPTAGATPVTASPGADHASPRKRWHRSLAPRLARQRKSPLCATIARLSPRATGSVSPPCSGAAPRARPHQGTHCCRRGGWEGGTAAAGTPAPAPRGARQQVWGCCRRYFKAELVLLHGWGGGGHPGTCLAARHGGDPAPQGHASPWARDSGRNQVPTPGRARLTAEESGARKVLVGVNTL